MPTTRCGPACGANGGQMATRRTGNRLWTPADTARQMELAAKRRKACELHVAGKSLDEIAVELGYAHRATAWKAIRKSLKETVQPAADEVRARALTRQEWLWEKARAAVEATGGDSKAIVAAQKVLDSTASLEGTKAPEKIQNVPGTMTADQARELLPLLLDRAKRLIGGSE
jgi:hypothetical protein